MAKVSERAARRASEVAAPIHVVRDGATADGKHPRKSSRAHVPHEADARLMHEVSEDLRTAHVPDRIAEAVARQIERHAADRIRALLRKHFAAELRALLRKHARNGFADVDPSDVLNDALAETLAEGMAETLGEQFSTPLRERLPVAIRAATARSAFAQRVGAGGVDDLAERLSAVAEATIRHHLVRSLRAVIRGRIAEVSRDEARDLLRVPPAGEHGPMSASDQVGALVEAIEQATHKRVARGVVERFRALVASSLHHATGERLGDGLHRTLAMAPRVGPSTKTPDRGPRPNVQANGLDERLVAPLTESIRGRLMEGLRERIEATCRENIDEVLRERLIGSIRLAAAEQRGAEHVDVARFAEVINYELAEVLRARICDGIRARTAEAVRTRLADAIRDGLAPTASD
ncbi:MAG TPA: hypothetical protein VGP95_11715 [Gemmatimonadaceae bacterium]|nr:hypothetical protein [Gemmatimonadaceae bacterium]